MACLMTVALLILWGMAVVYVLNSWFTLTHNVDGNDQLNGSGLVVWLGPVVALLLARFLWKRTPASKVRQGERLAQKAESQRLKADRGAESQRLKAGGSVTAEEPTTEPVGGPTMGMAGLSSTA